MLERFTENKNAVDEFLIRERKFDLFVSEEEWNILDKIKVNILIS